MNNTVRAKTAFTAFYCFYILSSLWIIDILFPLNSSSDNFFQMNYLPLHIYTLESTNFYPLSLNELQAEQSVNS